SVLVLARLFRRSFVVPFHEELPVGEIAINLRHAAKHYNRLPDLLLYLHPDAFEHISKKPFNAVLNMIARRQWPSQVPFVHLGHRHQGPLSPSGRVASELTSYCQTRPGSEGKDSSVFRGGSNLMRHDGIRMPSGAYCQWVELAWELLFERPLRLPEDDYGGYDYAQFVVSRESVRSRPQAFWERAWRALCSESNYQLLLGTRFKSWKVDLSLLKDHNTFKGFHKALELVFEHLWHIIFNPKATTWLWPTRLRDPTLPLSLKFDIDEHNPAMLRRYSFLPSDPLE
ncbi:unnamed protein product, partial [Polarella glacialis]